MGFFGREIVKKFVSYINIELEPRGLALLNSFGSIVLLSMTPLIASSPLHDMKKELKRAEKELETAHSKVLNLRETIAIKEIEQIKERVKQFQGSQEEWLDFLDLNRKNLASIMNEVPSAITEGQIVLDEILIAITDLKEQTDVADSNNNFTFD